MPVTFQDIVNYLVPGLLGLTSVLFAMIMSRMKSNEDAVKDVKKSLDQFIRECVTNDARFVDSEQCRKFHDRCRDSIFMELREGHKRDMKSIWTALRAHHHTNPANMAEDRVMINGSANE